MQKLTPTPEEIEALRTNFPPGPLVAINLLKFKPHGGYEAYLQYVAAAMPGAPADMKTIYTGKAGPDLGAGEDWDFVIIVEYSSVDSFASSVLSKPYRENAMPFRAEALEKTIWLVSSPASLDLDDPRLAAVSLPDDRSA